MTKSPQILPVTVRSVLKRAGRKLPTGQQLKAARSNSQREVAAYFIVDKVKGVIVDHDDDLTALSKRAGLIEPWEKVG
jgi:hypothetical protein